ncbi:glycosyl transferase family 2 [Halomarina oriensis]|uniref:Glycosyl transferase family 2 n=1 Tax=Halomarina oriensis TaxID=671145 RepID=A0A6B0GPE7_9EURY|nr:glycosyl transferase family 2 [Halomarina oriensis]MWG35419.1 glycosyl transferase family 2 [Halomarina oriensis]
MEYVQERVTTLHDFADPVPTAPTDRACVVVPMTEREYASLAAEGVLRTLERLSPARVVVALRASPDRLGDVVDWLDGFSLPVDVVWCDGPRIHDLLDASDLNGTRGKGRDVWLALGVALAGDSEYVVVHDADATNYSERHVARLLFPLARGFAFTKGYYARVEDQKLYGRLFRLFYTPLVRALESRHDAPLLDYLDAFRYALAGEFAATADLAATLRVQRGWGLEVGTLGDAFAHAGFEGTAQVDLGFHEHDHRAVSGPSGLGTMSEEVADALFHALADVGLDVDFGTLPDAYREAADALVRQYATDAAFNGFEYDTAGERQQVAEYAGAIRAPETDARLPAWRDAPISGDDVHEATTVDVEAER